MIIPHTEPAFVTHEFDNTISFNDGFRAYHSAALPVPSGKFYSGICPVEAKIDTAPRLNSISLFQSTNDTHNTHESVNAQTPRRSSIGFYYQNVRGLRSKIDNFFTATSDAAYDVIILTETWLNDHIPSPLLFGQAYSVYRKDRDPIRTGKSRGGGVLVAVSNKLASWLSPVKVDESLEQLWVCVSSGELTIYVGVLYLCPELAVDSTAMDQHIQSVSSISNHLTSKTRHILFGDFNQPNLIWAQNDIGSVTINASESTFSGSSNTLLDGMVLHGMVQRNYVKNCFGRSLDLVFINEEAEFESHLEESVEPLIDVDPYHPPLEITMNCDTDVELIETIDDMEFDFARTDFIALNQALNRIDWSVLENMEDVDYAVSFFTDELVQLFRSYVPAPRRPLHPPWSNRKLRLLKRKRASALRRYSSRKCPTLKFEFVRASTKYKKYNSFLYAKYAQRTQRDLKQNPKRFWNFIKSKRKEHGLPCNMYYGDRTAASLEEMCDLFVDHFLTAFESADPTTQSGALRDVPRNAINLDVTSFAEDDIVAATRKLKSSFTPGPDGIPSAILKKCGQSLAYPLTCIINLSLRLSKFPDRWKESYMFPAFKSGDKRNVANYRGVTSLCAGSKLFEILINGTLFNAVKNYISQDQHGFFPGRSTTTNLVEFTSYCLKNMQSGAQVDAVYTDLKAAFDRVNHQLLLDKMDHLGAPSKFVSWLKSYLADRRLWVKLGATVSATFQNSSGVPQGSNLGPLLFAVFFNDVCNILPAGCRLVYADDLKMFLIVRSLEDCRVLQAMIESFEDWCYRNHLSISVAKCMVITFSRKKKPLVGDYRIRNQPLQRVTTVKDLGVLLDSKLLFNEHYLAMLAKANRALGMIFKFTKEFRDPYCLRSLYYSLVRSILESAAVVWCPSSQTWNDRIESVQRKFIRFALRLLPWDNPMNLPPYQNRCRLLAMDTLEKRRNIMKAMFIAKLLTGEIDAPNILRRIDLNAPQRTLRNVSFIRSEFHRTDYGSNEPIKAMCDVFNVNYHLFDFNISTNIFKSRLITSGNI